MKNLLVFILLCLVSIIAKAAIINVLFVFTPDTTGKFVAPATYSSLEVARINTAFSGSGIAHTVSNAGAITITTNYASNYAGWQAALTDPAIRMAHDIQAADVVVVITWSQAIADSQVTPYQHVCGNSGQSLNLPSLEGVWMGPTYALAVVDATCSIVDQSSMHYLGHIMGAREQLAKDSNLTPYAAGHGWMGRERDGLNSASCFKDIMSETTFDCNNDAPFTGCPAWSLMENTRKYSNPAVTNNGVCAHSGTAYPTGEATYSNAASVLNSTGATVAGFHTTKLAAGLFGAMVVAASTMLPAN